MQAIRPSIEEMADRGLKYVENPTGDQLLVSGGESAQAHWEAAAPMVPIAKSTARESDHIHSHEHEHEQHHKKSVLARVKEKAKKWKSVLTKKKHAEGNSTPTTPSSLEDEDVDSIERDPEYHGAPMYESETAPKMYRERASKLQAAVVCPITPKSVLNLSAHSPHSPPVPAHEPLQAHAPDKGMILYHQGAVPSIGPPNLTVHFSPAIAAPQPSHEINKEPKLQHLDLFRETLADHSLIGSKDAEKELKLHYLDSFIETSKEPSLMAPATVTKAKGEDHNSIKTLAETVTEILAPAYNMVSDATSRIAAKIQSPIAGDEMGAKMVWDKGVSMKDYLLHKLEPGEEVKALSEVITEAISPRKVGAGELEDKGVVEKVKGAVSALLGKEEQMGTQQAQLTPGSDHPTTSRPLFKSLEESSILTSTYQDGIPIQATEVTREVLFTNYAHGVSIPTHKHTYEASLPAYKDAHADAHGALIAEFKQKYMDKALFLRDGQGTSIQASEYAREASMPASAIPSSGYIHGVSTAPAGYTHGASITESESRRLAYIRAPEGIHGASIHAAQHSHMIPASEYSHGTPILESVHTRDSPPLPVSTHPLLSPASTNLSPVSVSTNPSMVNFPVNPSTFQNFTNPFEEVEETSERRLQAYAN